MINIGKIVSNISPYINKVIFKNKKNNETIGSIVYNYKTGKIISPVYIFPDYRNKKLFKYILNDTYNTLKNNNVKEMYVDYILNDEDITIINKWKQINFKKSNDKYITTNGILINCPDISFISIKYP